MEPLKLNDPIYYSNTEMYEWLSKGQIDINIMKEEAPEFFRDYLQ
jgi:hypothetical protein